jgi:hypothetical protein
MKIQIIGNHPSAEMLRKYLEALGYQTGALGAKHKVEFAHGEPEVAVSGADSELLIEVVRMIRELCAAPVRVSLGSGSAVKIVMPDVMEIHSQAALGTLRALLKLTGHGIQPATQAEGEKKKAGVIDWLKQRFK